MLIDSICPPIDQRKEKKERARKKKNGSTISRHLWGEIILLDLVVEVFNVKCGTKLPVFQKDYIKIQWKWILHDCSPNKKRSRLARVWTNLNKNLEKINILIIIDGINPNKSWYQSEKILKDISTNLKRYLNKS